MEWFSHATGTLHTSVCRYKICSCNASAEATYRNPVHRKHAPACLEALEVLNRTLPVFFVQSVSVISVSADRKLFSFAAPMHPT